MARTTTKALTTHGTSSDPQAGQSAFKLSGRRTSNASSSSIILTATSTFSSCKLQHSSSLSVSTPFRTILFHSVVTLSSAFLLPKYSEQQDTEDDTLQLLHQFAFTSTPESVQRVTVMTGITVVVAYFFIGIFCREMSSFEFSSSVEY